MRESTVEKHLADRVKRLGGLCWKFVSPNLSGVPDRIVVLPGGRVYFVELKAPGRTPRVNQIRRARELQQRGAPALALDSPLAVDMWLEAITPTLTT